MTQIYDEIDMKDAQNISFWTGLFAGAMSVAFFSWFLEFISGLSPWAYLNLLG